MRAIVAEKLGSSEDLLIAEVAAPSQEKAMATALAAEAAAPRAQEPRQPTVEDLWPAADKPDSSKTPT